MCIYTLLDEYNKKDDFERDIFDETRRDERELFEEKRKKKNKKKIIFVGEKKEQKKTHF